MFSIHLDLHPWFETAETLPGAAQSAMKAAAEHLVPMTHAHISEQAQNRLHSRREQYVKALSMTQEGDDTWLVVLDQSAMWIEMGLKPHEMIDNLLTPKAGKSGQIKTAKDGSRYRAIPFHHGPGKGPATNTPAQQTLTDTIKHELRRSFNKHTGQKGIPFAKIETGKGGQPLLGKLHDVDITKSPLKTASGPGQGHGPIGSVRQGMTGIPFLKGIRIYQKKVKGEDGQEKVKRAVMTFRMVSSKHKGTGRWFHPGLEPLNLLDEGALWASEQWETKIVPIILTQLQAQL